uniref:Uncharacterized protein n=1 Tax=Ixodes ricinus TaxID=34613 RepID=A0A147BFY9_IXORI
MMKALAVSPSAMLARMHSACSFTSALWSPSRIRITACIICVPWLSMMWSMCCLMESRFRSRPRVFMSTLTSGSESSRNTWSVPSVDRIWALIFWSAWKAMFIRAQQPLSRSAGSSRRVSPHSSSTAPHSKMGSLLGENSSSRLQSVDEATRRMSSGALCSRHMRGRHTAWSWKVVRSCCTDRDKLCRHRTAASRTRPLVSDRLDTTCSIRESVSIIRLRMSSSLAPRAPKALKAACFSSCITFSSCSSFFMATAGTEPL